MMAATGPIPNRSEDLARPRERKGGDQAPITKGRARPATIPDANPDWLPSVERIWTSVQESGQSDFYQSSDYAVLYSLLDDLNRAKRAQKISGQLLQTIYSNMTSLLLTEGERRRVRIELDGAEDEEGEVVDMDAYMAERRSRLGLVQPDNDDLAADH